MKQKVTATIQENKCIAKDVYSMRLLCPTAALQKSGQFINILLDGFYLRRPISVCDWDENSITIIYKILGKGTAELALFEAGKQLDILVGLGNGFDIAQGKGKKVVLVGGGVGVPPLFNLAKQLIAVGTVPTIVLGFRSDEDAFYEKKFADLGCEVLLATEDGSAGKKGYVTTILQEMDYDYYFTCGPTAMLQAIYALSEEKKAQGQLSFEERMGCGFGACMGCSCHTKSGSKRVCVEGPVFVSEEVLFS